jgi:UDP-N-acetylglucosamine--N-acetylmuramyl-(pentapeptide) pyrophosphoryl-undecaprenol N-acetylglucosamine transferase
MMNDDPPRLLRIADRHRSSFIIHHSALVFAGGGTAGHLFPGLAVARRLAAEMPGLPITFAGSGRPWERHEVEAAGFAYLALRCRPFSRRLGGVISFLLDNWTGFWAADRFLRTHRVRVVVGLGGYASVPMAWAAARRGIPLVLLEQNALPGRATRYLARAATLICTSFAEASRHLAKARCPVCVTGNPIREGFALREPVGPASRRSQRAGCPADGRDARPTTHGIAPLSPSRRPHRQLLILGGSGGAQTLNETVPRALDRVWPLLAGWRIVHQTGERGFRQTRELYSALRIEAAVAPFISEVPGVGRQAGMPALRGQTGMPALLGQTRMSALLGQTRMSGLLDQTGMSGLLAAGMSGLLAESDLAVCRAGGTTLAELAAAAVPAILVPYPHAADDHQRKNAEAFAAAGGCLIVDQREYPESLECRLADAIRALVADPARRAAMADAMYRLARPNAAADVADRVLEAAGLPPAG